MIDQIQWVIKSVSVELEEIKILSKDGCMIKGSAMEEGYDVEWKIILPF